MDATASLLYCLISSRLFLWWKTFEIWIAHESCFMCLVDVFMSHFLDWTFLYIMFFNMKASASCMMIGMMTSSNGDIFRATGHLCGEFTGHKDQWHGALMFSLICAWINGWVNNREAGDLRRHSAHYDVTVMVGFCTPNTETTEEAAPRRWAIIGILYGPRKKINIFCFLLV